MRLKFKQGGTDAVIAVTNVHYCKHKVKVFDNKPTMRWMNLETLTDADYWYRSRACHRTQA